MLDQRGSVFESRPLYRKIRAPTRTFFCVSDLICRSKRTLSTEITATNKTAVCERPPGFIIVTLYRHALLFARFFRAMNERDLLHYLRTHRQWSGLTQDEVGFLIGGRSGMQISRYERFLQEPDLQTAIAFAVLFNVPIEEIFPGLSFKVECRTLYRIRTLARKLDAATPSRHTARKMQALTEAVSGSMSESGGWHWEEDCYELIS